MWESGCFCGVISSFQCICFFNFIFSCSPLVLAVTNYLQHLTYWLHCTTAATLITDKHCKDSGSVECGTRVDPKQLISASNLWDNYIGSTSFGKKRFRWRHHYIYGTAIPQKWRSLVSQPSMATSKPLWPPEMLCVCQEVAGEQTFPPLRWLVSSGMWDFWEKMESMSDIPLIQLLRWDGLGTMRMKMKVTEDGGGGGCQWRWLSLSLWWYHDGVR